MLIRVKRLWSPIFHNMCMLVCALVMMYDSHAFSSMLHWLFYFLFFFLFWVVWFNMYVWMVIWFCMTLTHFPRCTWIAFSELRHVVSMYANHVWWLSWPILTILFLYCFVLCAYDDGHGMKHNGKAWLFKAWNVDCWSCKKFGLLQFAHTNEARFFSFCTLFLYWCTLMHKGCTCNVKSWCKNVYWVHYC